ncbi:MAG: PPC domain-containing protein [Pirellulales bacterium]|nr:PPC domain-containing protein [Pirellulales bacterium]
MSRITPLAYRFIASAWISCALPPAIAAEPSITLIKPTGAQRGTEVDVTISGAQLGDAAQLLLYEPGIEVVAVTAEKEKHNSFKAKLKVAADCRLGMHALRVRTETGISNLLTFAVGALPEVAESEPNNEIESAQLVPLGTTATGDIALEDVDYFAVDAKKGERIVAELEGLRLGLTFFDPSLSIQDAKRFELARSDDATLLRQDPFCSLVAPADGRYFIRVQESAFGGDDRSLYRLHIGRFPRPTALVPAGGKPGETIEVTQYGEAAGATKHKVTIPADARERYPVYVANEHGVAPSPNWIRVADLSNTIEAEPNNDRKQATVFNAPGAVHGVIGSPGDLDHFKFTAKKGQKFQVRAYARKTLRSPLDPVITIREAATNKYVMANDDSGGSPDSYLDFTAAADGEYVIQIRDHLKGGGPDFAYRIEVAPPKPTLLFRLPQKVLYQDVTFSVPRGNRMAVLMRGERFNFGGNLNVQLGNLPQKVTQQIDLVPNGRAEIPVLLTAAADAPLDGRLVDVNGRPEDQNIQTQGRFIQRTMLVRGQNNRDMWGYTAHRIAAAVTREAPFHIDIVQPKVPVVRNGTMRLKVVARRAEGFDEPISLRMLYNPSGVSSSAAITIPKGKTEALIPLTANGSAALASYKIAVLARAKVGDGRIEVSSQLADLTVADRFFDFAYERAAVERGQATDLVVNITNKAPFDGAASVQVVGLPKGVTAEAKEITKDTKQLLVRLTAAADSPVGEHKSLMCHATVTQNGEPILHRMYGASLRINKPLPPKNTAAKSKPKPAAPAVASKPKPLSRLEQLRQNKTGTSTPEK